MLNRVLRITIVVVFAVTGLILTEYLLPYRHCFNNYRFRQCRNFCFWHYGYGAGAGHYPHHDNMDGENGHFAFARADQ